MTHAALHRYWLQLDSKFPISVGFAMGCGVTAFDEEDAIALLRRVYPQRFELHLTQVTADVTLSDLDSRHVLPNIGNPALRGVWFPDFGPVDEKDR